MSHLKGMKEICKYTGRSESTIIKLAREAGFPAAKIHTLCIWESTTELIDEWNQKIIQQSIRAEVKEVSRPAVEPMTARRPTRRRK